MIAAFLTAWAHCAILLGWVAAFALLVVGVFLVVMVAFAVTMAAFTLFDGGLG